MFKIMDKEKLFIPIKSNFSTASKAYDWAKKICLKILVEVGEKIVSIIDILL